MFKRLMEKLKTVVNRWISSDVKSTLKARAKDRFVNIALDKIRSRLPK